MPFADGAPTNIEMHEFMRDIKHRQLLKAVRVCEALGLGWQEKIRLSLPWHAAELDALEMTTSAQGRRMLRQFWERFEA